MEQFRQADVIAERLAAAAPDDIDAQMQLAKSRRRFGVIALRKLGDTEGGRRYLRQVLEIHRACLAKRPGDDDLRNELAHSLGQLAAAEMQLGHLPEARELYLEEVAVRESFSPARAGQLEIRRELAGLHEKLAELNFRMGARRKRGGPTIAAPNLREQVLSERPDFWPAINDLAMTYNNAGMVRFPQGRDPAGARPFHSKAVALYAKRAEDDPADQDVKARLATTLYYEATCALHSGDAAGAAAGYRRCLEIRKALATEPKFKMPQLDLMVALARCGEHAEAARIARALVEIPPKDEHLYFHAACGYALAAGAARDEGRVARAARGSIRSVIAAGLDTALARLYTRWCSIASARARRAAGPTW